MSNFKENLKNLLDTNSSNGKLNWEDSWDMLWEVMDRYEDPDRSNRASWIFAVFLQMSTSGLYSPKVAKALATALVEDAFDCESSECVCNDCQAEECSTPAVAN